MNKVMFLIMILFCKIDFATADTLRCKNKLVMEGDTAYEVKKKCGNPSSEENMGFVKVGDAYFSVTQYIYDFAYGKFLQTLEFRNGKLYRISNGPRT
ncbi:MAG: DUF2845 domain-containing protein [Paraglaciecola sp.]|nr:DUF2845 domain-containing protein [Paraglaciecola sp.]